MGFVVRVIIKERESAHGELGDPLPLQNPLSDPSPTPGRAGSLGLPWALVPFLEKTLRTNPMVLSDYYSSTSIHILFDVYKRLT